VRLPTYAHEPAELLSACDRLLDDEALPARLGEIAARLQREPGTVKAADLIERVARTGGPVAR
jgi:UDP:flavonoid glycosyltransferase YjiC (YdhE family)